MSTRKKAAEPKRPEGLRIVALEVENIKRVKVARITPKGDLIEITGRNGQGKSSLLEAIDWTLTGTTNMPSKPIRAGQRSAHVKIDLGEFIVERTFTKVEGGKTDHLTKLKITGKNKEVFPTPQRLLDGFMGAFTFDPLAFTRLEGKKQLELLRQAVTFDIDIDALEAMKKQAYEDRRIKGRELEASWARVRGMQAPPEDLPAEPIDTAALTAEYEESNRKLREIDAAKARKERLERDAATYHGEIVERENRLRELEAQMRSLKNSISEFAHKEQTAKDEAAAVVIEEMPGGVAIAERFAEAQATNRLIDQAKVYHAAKSEADKLQGEYQDLDGRVASLTAKREEAIASAKMPIEGLSVGDDEVLYKGLPFNQASTAEQIRASAAIAMALSPKLRVMRIMDGSLLDDESMAILGEMAERENYQIFVERVSSHGEVGIVMEDGTARGEGVQPVEAKF